MIMFDQSRRLSEPLRWGRREKTIVAALASCVAIAALALVAYGLTSGAAVRRDCVSVTFASTLGGAELKGCGARARRICASGSFHAIEHELRAACRRAGMRFRAG
ncbi:MAG TPA: hypothetical protein VKV16_06565 [Solirubrobacteraceae bacterium]|nr:hypothetical protein [Solirubrobacteraceae bacterium]